MGMQSVRSALVAMVCCIALQANAAPRVLYVTHEPGRWHDYTAQLQVFRSVAQNANWDLSVASGDVDALLQFLRGAGLCGGPGRRGL